VALAGPDMQKGLHTLPLAAVSTLLDSPADLSRLPHQQCLTLQKIERKITNSSTSTCRVVNDAVSVVLIM